MSETPPSCPFVVLAGDRAVLRAFVRAALPKGTCTMSFGVLASKGDRPPPCPVVFEVSGR